MDFKIYPPESQGVGQFDGGRITEIKPIPFPHEGPALKNLGPLFYWAWAKAEGYGKIGLHPHQGFEIMSYALQGEIGHHDTLGNHSRVQAGGAQVMQTGSGVSHEEETIGDHTEFFQIWFDPDIRKTFENQPTYNEYINADFPSQAIDGVTLKTVIGENAPIHLVSDAIMKDISIDQDRHFQYKLDEKKILASVVISGKGILLDMQTGAKNYISRQDFALIHARQCGNISMQADPDSLLRLVTIEVPAQVDYPLYRNR
ncbi:MAG: pirin family protein [Nitrospinae bacterium]|nr:pirin family protein [Nitrospinota bacterium]MBL7021019.1 pirin family protein [Nitrospinaceae bacterium]